MFRFLDAIKGYGDIVAFRMLDGENTQNITYKSYYESLLQCYANLTDIIGDIKGKRIGIYCDSTYEYTLLLTAIMYGRGVAVPLNIRESQDNISYELENSDVEYLIYDRALEQELSDDITVIEKSVLLKQNAASVQLQEFDESEIDNTALMVYTSGTTGKPKGVVITVGNLFGFKKTMYDSSAPFKSFEGLAIYTNFPFYHIGGINGWLTHFNYGCTTYLSVNPGNLLTDLETEVIDSAVVTPATLNLWKKSILRGRIERLGGAKLLVSAGAPVDINTVEVFMENGIGYGQYYGMSEASGNISLNFDCYNHLKSVGKADPNVQVEIIDGEICAKGPGIMKGYYKNPEATAETIIDGVLHTGDLGYMDEEGYIYITGRKKNLIILSGGENVSPEELEKLLYKCESIIECKIYAQNDRICADIYTEEQNSDKVMEFISELNTTLPIYKRIYKKNIKNEPLEKTASGKIKR